MWQMVPSMRLVLLWTLLLCTILGTPAESNTESDLQALLTNLVDSISEMQKQIKDLTDYQLAQDIATREHIRSSGQSGIKFSHVGTRTAGMHNHANFERVIGLGEISAVLNGVEFRTRHNDYSLVQPSTTSGKFHKTQDIIYPEVPPAVLDEPTVEGQINEMRKYFKAWRDQDPSLQNYKPYFQANLCYLEGAFYYPDEILVDQIFSELHQIQSPDFVHLQKQFKFTSDSGREDDLENMAFLPRVVYRVVNGTPEYAQWNYRLLCHPIKEDVPLNRFRVVDELATRMNFNNAYSELPLTMRARFQLNCEDADEFDGEQAALYEYLDDLMGQIPGLNNYKGYLEDTAFDEPAFRMDINMDEEVAPLNTARYHRRFISSKKGTFGAATRHRGFHDNYLFVAMNTQPEVVPTEVEYCAGSGRDKRCTWHEQRFSYAIPIEIVYTTPLTKWNPHHVIHKGDALSDFGKTVNADERNGDPVPEKAYDGVNNHKFYITPAEFFDGDELASDPADITSRGATGVLDGKGNMHLMRSSGHRVFLPKIPEVGIMRQRYPIMPIHGEGDSLWKEVEALKDVVLDYQQHQNMYRSGNPEPDKTPADEAEDVTHRPLTLLLDKTPYGNHTHLLELSKKNIELLFDGHMVSVLTEVTYGHRHEVQVRYILGDTRTKKYFATTINQKGEHSNHLRIVENPEQDAGVL